MKCSQINLYPVEAMGETFWYNSAVAVAEKSSCGFGIEESASFDSRSETCLAHDQWRTTLERLVMQFRKLPPPRNTFFLDNNFLLDICFNQNHETFREENLFLWLHNLQVALPGPRKCRSPRHLRRSVPTLSYGPLLPLTYPSCQPDSEVFRPGKPCALKQPLLLEFRVFSSCLEPWSGEPHSCQSHRPSHEIFRIDSSVTS